MSELLPVNGANQIPETTAEVAMVKGIADIRRVAMTEIFGNAHFNERNTWAYFAEVVQPGGELVDYSNNREILVMFDRKFTNAQHGSRMRILAKEPIQDARTPSVLVTDITLFENNDAQYICDTIVIGSKEKRNALGYVPWFDLDESHRLEFLGQQSNTMDLGVVSYLDDGTETEVLPFGIEKPMQDRPQDRQFAIAEAAAIINQVRDCEPWAIGSGFIGYYVG